MASKTLGGTGALREERPGPGPSRCEVQWRWCAVPCLRPAATGARCQRAGRFSLAQNQQPPATDEVRKARRKVRNSLVGSLVLLALES